MRCMTKSFCTLLLFGSLCSAQTKPAKPGAPATEPEPSGAGAQSSAKLPVRRVVLYKNGIGYFEHLGRVRGDQDVHIDFTSAQLNDVLKSLTVLDLSGGRITGVDYNSEAPLARRLATLRLALGEKPSVAEFLGALRGARVEVRGGTGAAVAGRLLSVERKTRSSANWTVEADEISLITDSGEVHTVDLTPAMSVRIAEKDLQTEVGKYLGLIASARDQDIRRMTISTAGSGERNLYVSYISEVPIWKTTYRIVMPTKADKKPLLQGWAIVDNTVGEDWNNVELSLVAGAPHSFIQQLSEPYYGRRPVIPMPESVQFTPQTHGATLIGGKGRLNGVVTDSSGASIAGSTVRILDENNNVVAQANTDNAGNYVVGSLADGTYRVEIDKSGFKKNVVSQLNVGPGENQLNAQLQVGSATETINVEASVTSALVTESGEVSSTASPRVARRGHLGLGSGGGTGGGSFVAGGVMGGVIGSVMSPSPANIEAARTMAEAAANGQDLGDLFEYKLKDRVTLKKNQSALVPIAQTEIEADKVSLWNSTSGAGRPLRGLWLKNTSPLTLDGGSFTVLEDEVFAGEGLMDPIKPGERRLLSFAADLALLVEAQKSAEPQHITRAKITHGVLTQVSEQHERTLYTARNQDSASRTLVIEHPARPDWKLAASAPKPDEKAPGTYRFRTEVPPKATVTLSIEEAHPLQTTYEISNLDDDQIALFIKQKTISPEMQQALEKVLAQKAVVTKLEAEMEARQHDIDGIVADQSRLRENLKALKGSAEEKALTQRYTRQLDDQETQLDTLRKKIQGSEAQRDLANEVLEKMIEDLSFDATF
jgi:hypothetical protein